MALKYALEAAVPGALAWLDQDARDKTEAGAHAALMRAFAFLRRRPSASAVPMCFCTTRISGWLFTTAPAHIFLFPGPQGWFRAS